MADSMSSSSDSSSDTGERSPTPPASRPLKPGKRKATKPAHEHKPKRQRNSDAIRVLTEKVSEISDFLGNFCQPISHSSEYGDDLNAEVSRELYSDDGQEPTITAESTNTLKLSLNTVLKEPSVPKSLKTHVDTIQAIQHFDSEDWSNLRYSEVQKHYCSRPGFTELESNDEIKPYDRFPNLSLTERGFAAITQALIKQQEAAQSSIDSLVKWSKSSSDLSPQSLLDKIKELFVEGDFQKISNDALQLACGHRADLIQQRRDNILRSVKDKYFKATLRKIPPSSEFIFQKENFSSAVDKNGGIAKTFWPVRQPSQNKPAAQAGTSHSNYKLPAQGTFEPKNFYLNMPRFGLPQPAQGHQNHFNSMMSRRDMHRPQNMQTNFQGNPSRQRGSRFQFSDGFRHNAGRGQNKNYSQNFPRRDYQQKRKL